MAKPASNSGADGTPDCNSVYIDTNLGTTLVIGVSSYETVADLKQKVLQEHVRKYPRIGGINVDGLKVKRRGKFYYLTDPLLVKSLFHAVTKYWYIAVDASTLEGDNENRNFLNPSGSNNLAPLSLKIAASDDLVLPMICSTSVDHNQIQKQIVSFDQLGLDVARGGGSRNIELGIKLVEEPKSLDVNDESGPSVQEKDDSYVKENGIQKTSKEGTKSISEAGGIGGKPSSIPSEERAAETTTAKNNKGKGEKRKRKFASEVDNAEVPESGRPRSQEGTEAPDSFVGNANGVVLCHGDVINGPDTASFPESSKAGGTLQSEKTREPEKHIEPNNAKSAENSVDVPLDQSLEDNPKSEPPTKRRRKIKQAKTGDGDLLKDVDNAEVLESGRRRSQKEIEASDSFSGNANGVVLCNGDASNGPNTNLFPEVNKAGGTLQSEMTGELEKHIELNNAKLTENSVDVPLDQSLEDNLNSEPAAKKKRKIKPAGKGDEDLLKEDGTLVSESNKLLLELPTISEKSPVDKQHTRNGTLDGSSIGAPEAVHLQLVSPNNEEKKKKKKKKKSAKPSNQEEPAVPSTMTNVGLEHFGTQDNSSNLGENPAAALTSGQQMQDVMSSQPDAMNPTDKQGDANEEMNLRPSSVENCTRNKEVGNVEGGHEDSGAANCTARELEKHIEINNAKSTANSVDVPLDQSLEDNLSSEPAVKKKRKIKQAKEGDEDLLKDNGTLVSESSKLLLEHSTISEKSPVDKDHTRNATLDGSSVGAPEAVHLQLVSPSNEKKKKKKKKKSAKPSNQEADAVPSTTTNVGIEHFGMQDNSSNLGENPAATFTSGQEMRGVISSEPEAMNPTDKQGDADEEINLRSSSVEIGPRNKETCNVEGGHVDSGAANRSAISAEDNSFVEVQASNKTEKENKISRHDNETHKDEEIHVSNQNNGADEHQNHVSGQNSRAVEREFSLEIPPQTASSEKHKKYAQDDLHSKAKEGIVDLKLLEGSEAVDPSKLSKKKKKSKKRKDLASVIPPTSKTEHVKGFMSSILPTTPQKIANGDNLNDTFSKEESNRLPEVRKEMDIASNSFLTDKEINDVIQNVVESVQQMGKHQVGTESVHGKSRKKSSKKQISDAELLPQSSKQNESPGKNNPGDMLNSSEVIKQATLANTGTTNHSIGSLLDCGKDTTAENDPGIQSSQVLAQCSQVVAQKLESKSKKRSREAVSSGSSSRSGRANEVTDNVELSCQSDGVDFNDYFTPKKQNLETAGSSQRLVDESTKTNGANDTVKAKNKKKKKKHDACSDVHNAHADGPPSDLKTPHMLNNNHELGAKAHTGTSSAVNDQVSLTKANTKQRTLHPNKVPLEVVSDRVSKPLVSSKSDKAYSVPEEASRSYDAKPTGTVNGSKSKKAEPNLENSKKLSLPTNRVNGHQSLEDGNLNVGRKASAVMNGEVVNSVKKQSLVGVSGSIFKSDSDQTSSSGDNDSDASTRTPSDGSLSSDYSDGESNAGSRSWNREEVGRKMISSGMRLDEILRSSTTYKKAKLTESQSQDPESQPVDFVPDSQAQA